MTIWDGAGSNTELSAGPGECWLSWQGMPWSASPREL
jgi:hypothetical protein